MSFDSGWKLTQGPRLDKRNFKEISTQTLDLARHYFSQQQWQGEPWTSINQPVNTDDPAVRMMTIFARLMELLVLRLNRVPVKHFLSFLEMVGVEQKVGNPAEVPVTFLPAKSAASGGHIPAGTQVATTQTDTADAQVFETLTAFYATNSRVQDAVNVIPVNEKYSRLGLITLPPQSPDQVQNSSGKITAFKLDEPSLLDIDHVMYLESKYLFRGEEPFKLILDITLDKDVKAMFDSAYLLWKRYDGGLEEWLNIDPADISYNVDLPVDNNGLYPVQVTIDHFIGTAKRIIDDKEGYWLACHFFGSFDSSLETPLINSVSGSITTQGASGGNQFTAKIEKAFVNSEAVDPSKPVYPFGYRPQYGDAFYIGNKEAFAPNVENVTLAFNILPYSDAKISEFYVNLYKATGVSQIDIVTTLAWEYLRADGEWTYLASYTHTMSVSYNINTKLVEITRTADADSQNGTLIGDGQVPGVYVSFPGFPGIGLMEINKEKNYWLRAVVRQFDAYGKEAWMETAPNDPNGFTFLGPTLMPPIIESASLTYSYKTSLEPVNAILTLNNFLYRSEASDAQPPASPFVPFSPITALAAGDNPSFISSQPALYLGFDTAFGDIYISLFFHLAEPPAGTGYALERGAPALRWEYAAQGGVWNPLDVKDGTANLTGAGVVSFTGPNDSEAFLLFGTSPLFWYRVRLVEGSFDFPPVIRGIYLNTVMAENRVVSGQEVVIGSAGGTGGQVVTLVRTPVAGGELWVREAEPPGEEEMENLLLDAMAAGLEEIVQEDLYWEKQINGSESEHWVRWIKVPHFLASGPGSRHYTLDAVKGEITFGNGRSGRIPPAGKDNLVIRNYRTGGGRAANQAASPLAVKELKSSLPYIDKVFNVLSAVGGSDPWTLDQAMAFGPQAVKNRNRAVTIEDYQWMVLQEFSQVARARCIPTALPGENGELEFDPGAATVIVVPDSTESRPQASRALLRRIGEYLKEKTLGTIVHKIHVIGPGFREISVTAHVIPGVPEESGIVEGRIMKNLQAFFHPLTGGESGKGWEFGRDIYISEVYAIIEGTEGVDVVKKAFFTDRPTIDYIQVADNALGYSGSHEIIMEMN